MGFLVCVHVDFTIGAARLAPYHPLLVGCDVSDRRWSSDCLTYCAYTMVLGYKVNCGEPLLAVCFHVFPALWSLWGVFCGHPLRYEFHR